jgi:Spy/CpxP family protein refolding chaperone
MKRMITIALAALLLAGAPLAAMAQAEGTTAEQPAKGKSHKGGKKGSHKKGGKKTPKADKPAGGEMK